MHPLLARGLEMGVHADGMADDAGSRVRVEARADVLRCEVRDRGGASLGIAWRYPPAGERPSALPGAVPFLPGLSSVAVQDRGGLTVTWPAPPPSLGVPGAMGLFGGIPRATASVGSPDPVAEAWARFAAEGAAGDRGPALREALVSLTRLSEREGWEVVAEERVEGPLVARVVRLAREGAERSLTFSRALGVSSLVLLEGATGP